MRVQYDDKGKFFTEVIPKDLLRAVIQTTTHCFHATIHVNQGQRLVDDLNRSGKFLALTDVEIYSPSGELLYQRGFMTLNRDHIVWIIPEDDPSQQHEAEEN